MPTELWRKNNQEKVRKHRRDWYHRNQKVSIAKSMKRKRALKEWIKNYKSGLICKLCPESAPECIEFHHKDPTKKDAEISTIVFIKGWGIERILAEIDKCIPVCSNCHRKIHSGRIKIET
jgi:hypothetical protein